MTDCNTYFCNRCVIAFVSSKKENFEKKCIKLARKLKDVYDYYVSLCDDYGIDPSVNICVSFCSREMLFYARDTFHFCKFCTKFIKKEIITLQQCIMELEPIKEPCE